MRPLMDTDSEQLMREGVRTGGDTFPQFLAAAGWSRDELDRTVCHQVGQAHRKLMLATLGIDPAIDCSTVGWLGNTGSVALPVALGYAAQTGQIRRGDRVGLLGIGSGINCLMLGVQWQQTAVASNFDTVRPPAPHLAVERFQGAAS